MSLTVQSPFPSYLREARIEAGYTSRSTAQQAVPYAPETLGRLERGEVPVTPEAIVHLANGYRAPELLPAYCTQCPVGKELGRCAAQRDLLTASVRMSARIRRIEPLMNALCEIVEDGEIDQRESPQFQRILALTRETRAACEELELWEMSHKKGTAPTAMGTEPRTITHQ